MAITDHAPLSHRSRWPLPRPSAENSSPTASSTPNFPVRFHLLSLYLPRRLTIFASLEFFTRELSEEGYSGCEVRVTHARTEIIIRATHTQEVLGEKGRRIRELTSLVQKRFRFPEGSVER